MDLGRGIYLRGSVYWLSYQKNKTRHYVTLQTNDPAVALTRAAEVRAGLAEQIPDADGLRAEVDRFVEQRRTSGKWSRNTVRVHGEILVAFAKDTGEHLKPSQVTPAMARAYYAGLQAKLKESGAQIRIRALKTFFGDLVKRRKLAGSPFERIELRDIPQFARTSFCTRAQRDKLLANAPNDDLKFVLFCGFHCGMRRGEIVEARAGWFNVEPGGSVHIQNTPTFTIKDQDNRHVPLTNDFRGFLAKYLPGRAASDFALRPKVVQGKGRYRYDFQRPFVDYVTTQDLRWVGPHVMRKTFASLLVQAGVSIYKVARWIGDEVDTAQKHYAHMAPQDAEIEKLM